MLKQIEVLVTLDISPDQFFNAIISTPIVSSLNQYYNYREQMKKNHYLYIYEYAELENNLLFFVYSYLCYTHLQLL